MITEVRMLGNGVVIMTDEVGERKTTNVFADHIKALVNTGAVNQDTKLFIPYHADPILVKEWFEQNIGEQQEGMALLTEPLVVDEKQITIFDIIKQEEK